MEKLNNHSIKELNSCDLITINGGAIFVPALIWTGKAAAAAAIGYFAYETVDGVVKGVTDSECGCS